MGMWVLSSKGSALENRQIWLAPGSKYTIGRKVATDDSGSIPIKVSPQWVSRRHLQIIVHKTHNHSPPRIELVDLGTKFGAVVGLSKMIKDGEKINDLWELLDTANSSVNVKHDITIILGGRSTINEVAFDLQFQPFSVSWCIDDNKDSIASKDSRNRVVEVLEPRGIPVTTVVNSSTKFCLTDPHMDTTKLLFALIINIPIVRPEFIAEVLVDKCLEIMKTDFNRGLQLAVEAASSEYALSSDLAPNLKRKTFLLNYLFVSFNAVQYEALSSAIEAAGAQILLCDLTSSCSDLETSEEIHDYVRENAFISNKSLVVLKYPLQSDPSEKAVQRLKLVNGAARLLEVSCVDVHDLTKAVISGSLEGLTAPTSSLANSTKSAATGRRIVKRRLPRAIDFLDALSSNSTEAEALPPLKKKRTELSETQRSTTESITPVATGSSLDLGKPTGEVAGVTDVAEKPGEERLRQDLLLELNSEGNQDGAKGPVAYGDILDSPPPPGLVFDSGSESQAYVEQEPGQEPDLVPTLQLEARPAALDEPVNDETISKIQRLTVVDESINLHGLPRTASKTRASRWQDNRPNFKQFSKSRPTKHLPRYAAAIKKSITLAPVGNKSTRQDQDLSEMLEDHQTKRRRSQTTTTETSSKRQRFREPAYSDVNDSSFTESLRSEGSHAGSINAAASIFDLEFGKTSVNDSLSQGNMLSDFDDRDDDEHIFRFSN